MAKSKNTKATKVEEIRSDERTKVVGNLTLDSVTTKLASVQVDIQQKLAGVGTALMTELQLLDQVKAEVAAKKAELKSLHDIEASATTLEEMKLALQEQRETMEREQEEFDAQMTTLEENRATERKQEEADYEFDTRCKRREDEQAWKEQQAEALKKHNELIAKRDAALALREEAVKKTEAEIAEVKKAVADFPTTLQKEKDAVAAAVARRLTAEFDLERKLAAQEKASLQALSEQKVEAAQAANERLHAEVATLRKELEQAREDVKVISTKALESAGRSQQTIIPYDTVTSLREAKGGK